LNTGRSKIRIGIAGLGFGAGVHAPAFMSIPGVEVVALAGTNPERAAAAARQLGITAACVSAGALLDYDLDAISLALPPAQNEAVATAALARGWGVLCEKPLAVDSAVAQRLAAAARGRITAVDFQFAELEVFRQLKALIEQQRLGSVRHAQITWLNQSWAQQHRSQSWKTSAMLGGGANALFGSHLFFLMEWLFGVTKRLTARCDRRATGVFVPAGEAAEDLIHLTTEHASGAVVSATFGNANPGLNTHRWTIVCERGSIVLDNPGQDYMAGFTLVAHAADGSSLLEAEEPNAGGDGRLPPFRRIALRFVEAIRGDGVCHPDFSAGARVQSLMQAVTVSDSTGNRPVAVQQL
jgi:predicted dehydrogenase